MRYDLSRLVRQRGTRRSRVVLREIEVTRTIERELEALIVQVVRQWQASVLEYVLPAYGAARDELMRDDASDRVKRALSIATQAGTSVVVSLAPQVREWIERLDRWHRSRWAAVVRAGTGVDAFPFIDLQRNSTRLDAMLERITSLIRDIDETARKDVAETVWRGFLEQTPRREMGRQIAERLAIQRRRADFIASDQANKTAAELTRIRQEEAGITKFAWETAKDERVRAEHRALQGKVYAWSKPPSVGLPGTPPRCRCTGRAVIEFDDEE